MVAKRILFVLVLLFVVSNGVDAERLPIKVFTSVDGLPSNRISRIVRDTRGFLWFCTEDGLSRFDGYTFTIYTTQQGLPSNWVDDFLETRSGLYLVATAAGLCVFDPRGIALPRDKLSASSGAQAMFTAYRPSTDELGASMKVLYEDSSGQVWCGTRRGLYRVITANGQVTFRQVDLGIQSADVSYHQIRSIVEGPGEVLWIATGRDLYRRLPDGKIEKIKSSIGLPNSSLMSLAKEDERQFWLGARSGVWRISQRSSAEVAEISFDVKHYSKEGLPCAEVNSLFWDSDGRLWVATDCGLHEFLTEQKRFVVRLDDRHLPDSRVWSLNEDASGNLWVGTAHGAIKLDRNGFTTFTEADGIGFRDTLNITETSTGDILLYTRFGNRNSFIDRFDGERFISQKVQPRAFSRTSFDWFENHFPLQDSQGEWWWPTQNGLFRFARANQRVEEIFNANPVAHYTVKDGLPGNYLYGIYEDRRGDIWISTGLVGQTGAVRWERATGKFVSYSKTDGLITDSPFWAICEDGLGNLWIGASSGSVARYSQGKFRTFTVADGVPDGKIRQLLFDTQGRIWIASDIGGLGRIDDPTAERPEIVKYTTAEGMASNSILFIAEDLPNRYYVATTRGLNYVDFDRNSFKRFTTSDGLANDQIVRIFRDSRGAFWFGAATGVSRLLRHTKIKQTSPSILITGINVSGQAQSISAVGETDVRGVELSSNQNQVEIAFGSLSFAAGDLIRYQYKLEGADSDWRPTAQRTISFANLAPGNYRFLVRAINADGVMSETPAGFSFRILSPIWRRWWFAAIVAGLVALIAFALYRYRVARLLDLERVRTRIATDLHDDIGSSLSQIAIMSEVVRQKVGAENQAVMHPLSVIAGTSRELVDSMADIVWSINPKRDHLIDLTERMRQFAGDVLAARNVEFTFTAPGLEGDTRIETDLRREVFLIFKEAINNAVRHSECSSVEIGFGVSDNRLMLKVTDNGRSFDPGQGRSGHGLASMRRRAESVGGTLEILAEAGQGTTVKLHAPLHRRRLRGKTIST